MLGALCRTNHDSIQHLHASINEKIQCEKAQQEDQESLDGSSGLGNRCITDRVQISEANGDGQGAVFGQI